MIESLLKLLFPTAGTQESAATPNMSQAMMGPWGEMGGMYGAPYGMYGDLYSAGQMNPTADLNTLLAQYRMRPPQPFQGEM